MSDPQWEESFVKGQIIDNSTLDEYQTILMQINEPVGIFSYPYRMFFFKENETTPTLILSLEVGIMFGTCALGGHNISGHMNFGNADINMKIEDFKNWALSVAKDEL